MHSSINRVLCRSSAILYPLQLLCCLPTTYLLQPYKPSAASLDLWCSHITPRMQPYHSSTATLPLLCCNFTTPLLCPTTPLLQPYHPSAAHPTALVLHLPVQDPNLTPLQKISLLSNKICTQKNIHTKKPISNMKEGPWMVTDVAERWPSSVSVFLPVSMEGFGGINSGIYADEHLSLTGSREVKNFSGENWPLNHLASICEETLGAASKHWILVGITAANKQWALLRNVEHCKEALGIAGDRWGLQRTNGDCQETTPGTATYSSRHWELLGNTRPC